jgi:hypothetical protein
MAEKNFEHLKFKEVKMIAMVKKVTFAALTWSVLTVNALSGADCVWTGDAGDGKWSTAGNWQDDKTPSTGDKVVLTGAGTVNSEINNDIGEAQEEHPTVQSIWLPNHQYSKANTAP